VLTEDAPAHHPWQHGLYVGLHHVGGVDFWTEHETDGTFHPHPLAPPLVEGSRAAWTVEAAWRAPDGSAVLAERQEWAFTDLSDRYRLDLTWWLIAERDLEFGQHPYGGLFLRMPFRGETGGVALNSEGQQGAGAEQQRARWVAVAMPIPGRPEGSEWAGVAVLDHPRNPEHPVPWRVDGQLGVAPSRCIAGPWRLEAGETATSWYRLVAFAGQPDPPAIEAEWQVFAAEGPAAGE
jgi:hypothetical protein